MWRTKNVIIYPKNTLKKILFYPKIGQYNTQRGQKMASRIIFTFTGEFKPKPTIGFTSGRPLTMNVRHYLDTRKKMEDNLRVQKTKLYDIEFPINPKHIKVCFRGKYRGDLSNYVNTVLDALVNAGIIQDDGPKYVRSLSCYFDPSEYSNSLRYKICVIYIIY